MPAYLVVTARITGGGDALRSYMVQAHELALSYGAVYLTRGSPDLIYEGSTWQEREQQLVLIQFPTMERLRAFFEGDAYRAIVSLRANTGDYDVVAFEGAKDMTEDAGWKAEAIPEG